MTTTTWNPSDKSSAVTLSNGNLTATGGNSNDGARGTTSHTTGKWYFEYNTTFDTAGIGLGSSVANYNSTGQISQGAFATGTGINGGVNSYSPGWADIDGTVLSVAVDLGAQVLWFASGSSPWDNNIITANENPATGVGGLPFGTGVGGVAAGTAMFLFCRLQANSSSPHVTMQTSGVAAGKGVPAGFAWWDAAAPIPPSSQGLILCYNRVRHGH